jgi:hypothetical protein
MPKLVCPDLAAGLLRLEDRIAMHDFEGRRFRSLLGCACADLPGVAARLATDAWNSQTTLAHRLDALEVLSHAAARVAGEDIVDAPEDFRDAHLSRGRPIRYAALKAREEERKRLTGAAGKTRRWSYKSRLQQQEAKPNAFAPLAGQVFFPLLSGWTSASAARLLGPDFLFLGKLLITLGVRTALCPIPASKKHI